MKRDCSGVEIPYLCNPERPLIISHRGSCGEIPDHSAAAYSTAYYGGTDFDEPDLQVTKDGVLFIMHYPCMKGTTNIEDLPQFSDRRTTTFFKTNETMINCTDDYLVNDFTWTELIEAGLKVKTRMKNRNHFYDNMFPPMRLEDAIELLLDLNEKAPRKERQFKTGLYIETKNVRFYKEKRNVDIANILYETLKKYNLETVKKATKKLPIIIESFEHDSLVYFKSKTDLPTIQLVLPSINYDFDYVATFADGVGPHHSMMFNYTGEDFNLDKPSKFIEFCHSKNLQVHPWVLQDDILSYSSNPIDEAKIWAIKGVDGYFTEFPESTLSSLEYFNNQEKKKMVEISS